jgi:periplasmic divalent cation tolerance protein
MTVESSPQDYCLVLTTAGSEAEATAIAQGLVQAQLAACVSLSPIRSIYNWQGEIQQEQEWQLLIKTKAVNFGAIEAHILELHSYEVPEIIAIPIQAGSTAYLNWVSTVVSA